MALVARRVLHRQLLARWGRVVKHSPIKAAAHQIAKNMAIGAKTATIYYDRTNARLGRYVDAELARRGVKVRSIGLLGKPTEGMLNAYKARLEKAGFREPFRKHAAETIKTGNRVVGNMARANSVIFLTGDIRGEHYDAVDRIVESAERRYGKSSGSRAAIAIGITPKATREVLTARPKPMRRFTALTMAAVRGCRQIRVKTRSGTDIVFSFTNRHRWVADEGVITKNYWGNLPAGEVFTSPLSANGTLVLDGVMTGIGLLNRTPIRVQIRNDRAVLQSVQCADARVKEKFLKLLSTDANASRIGEFGLGTNVAVKRLTGNDLVDEKFPGVHFAFGDPEGSDTGARWASEEHNDSVLSRPTIIVDGRTIMLNGRSLLR